MDEDAVARELNAIVAPFRSESQNASAEQDVEYGEAAMAVSMALDYAAYKSVRVPTALLDRAVAIGGADTHGDSIQRLRALAA